MSNELTISKSQELVSQELNAQITAVLSNNVQGFQKAFVMASAIQVLKDKLTPEFMAPIMALQGSKLGFKTDKDLVKNPNTGKYEKGPGYPMEIVKDCLIEMVLIGLQPTGNDFNIIGGNSYVTKEGGASLLKTVQGLSKPVITYSNVTQSADKKTANVTAIIKWEYQGERNEEKIDFPIKSDPYTTFDALVGKAERKAKVWLYNTINGTNISDGDIQDISHEAVKEPLKTIAETNENKQYERISKHIEDSTTIEQLEKCYAAIREEDHDLQVKYADKKRELTPKK